LVIKYDAYLYLLQSNIHFAVSLNIWLVVTIQNRSLRWLQQNNVVIFFF
jgi:hypothetical protein